MEEFKQRCLNQPYGDVGHLLRPLAYQTHPYQWPTIGKELSHIANATLEGWFKQRCLNSSITTPHCTSSECRNRLLVGIRPDVES